MPDSRTNARTSENTPKIAVLIACPNGAGGLATTVDSSLSQTVPATSLQIVTHADDVSANALAEQYVARFPDRMRHQRTHDRIAADNLASALQAYAEGDFTVLCLAGDELRPHRIETALESLRTNPSFGGVFSRIELVDEHGKRLDNATRESACNAPYESERWRLLHGAQPCSGTATLRTGLYKQLRKPPTVDAVGDLALWAQLLDQHELYFDAEVLVRRRAEPRGTPVTPVTQASATQTALCVFHALQGWSMDRLFRLHSPPETDARQRELAQCHARLAQHFLDLDAHIFGRAFLYSYEGARLAHRACTLDPENALALSLLPEIRRRLGASGEADNAAPISIEDWRQTDPPMLEIASVTTPPPAASVLAYMGWRQKRLLQESDGEFLARRMAGQWKARPRFTIVCPASSAESRAACLDDLGAQIYPEWMLVVPGGMANTADARVIDTERSAAIADILQRNARDSLDDWVLLIPEGATVEPHALFALADAIDRKPQWQLIYADDVDKTSTPRFKPDFDPVLLAGTGYLGAVAIAAPLLQALAASTPYSQDLGYALAWQTLGCLGETAIGHIDDILFGDVRAATSPPAALIEACAAHHFKASGHDLQCIAGPCPETVWSLPTHTGPWPSVTLICCGFTETAAEALRTGTDYPGTLNAVSAPGTTAAIKAAFADDASEYVVLVRDGITPDRPDWLPLLVRTLIGWKAAAAGPAILDAEGRLESAGLALGIGGIFGPMFPQLHFGEAGDELSRAALPHRVSALASHCIALQRTAVDACGGVGTDFVTLDATIADLCIRLGRQKSSLIWTPMVALHHRETGSAQTAENPLPFVQRWLTALANDPFWNRNLSLQSGAGLAEADLVVRWQPERRDALRVLALPLRPSGQSEYRVVAPLRALEAMGHAQTVFACEPQETRDRAPTPVELQRISPDVLYAQAAFDDVRLKGLLLAAQLNPSILRVFSLDDRVTDVPAYNRSHRRLPREAVERNMRLALSACQRLVVSTQPLADQYAGQIDDIRIVPNRLEKALWEPIAMPPRRKGRKPRVGWAGASQHFGDLAMIAGVVEALADEVEWVFFGMIPPGCEAFVSEYIPPIRPFALYPERLATMALDLALAPLEVNLFNEAKSNLRLLEYGFFGWPVIASDIYPYRTDQAPVTLVGNSEAQWIAAIRTHIHDLDAAERLGRQLREWVRKDYLLEDHTGDWLAALTP